MHRLILFITFVLMFAPTRTFAQLGQTALQDGDACKAARLHVQIKLKNGDRIKGEALEISKEEVKLCRDGRVQTIAGEQIHEIKDRQTLGLRLRRAARVVGLTFAGLVIFGLLAHRQTDG